ncbi:MAG TPA: amidohydrolase family protein [Methylomirabilota bacterium]|nr:amidohydrolase family protein [Methylomirabilota bacterium]
MPGLLLQSVRPMAGALVDLLATDGVIARIGADLTAPAGVSVVDGRGGILLPALVDAHMHLDKTFWGLPWRAHGAGPTTRERIENERRLRRELALPADVQAERLARQAVSRGTLHIRSHVDVDTEVGLRNFEAVMTARSRLRDTVSIQVVAFPQSGVVSRPGTAELLEQAVKDGAELIGGVDPIGIDGDAAGQLDVVFGIAGRHGAGVDIHLHDGGEEGAAQIRMIAERTRALGLAGKVAVSHAFCLGMVDEGRLARLLDLLREQRIAIVTTAPGDRPTPPLRRLREAGVAVGAGSDGVRDAWTPFGNADMLERAMLVAYRNGYRADPLLHDTLDIVTRANARVLGLEGYGLEVGRRADLVVVPGETLGEIVAMRPPRTLVVSGGRVVARDGQCVV